MDEDRYFQIYAELLRERMKRRWHPRRGSARRRASIKRAIQKKIRKIIGPLKNRQRPAFEVNKAYWQRKFRHSPFLDAAFPARPKKWKAPYRRQTTEPATLNVQNFSFLTNPIETLLTFRRLAELESDEGKVYINFEDPYCTDITPFMVLALLQKNILPIFVGGRMEPSVQKVLTAVGMRSALNMQFPGLSNLDDVWAFRMQRRHPAGTSESETRHLDVPKREHVADEFCDQLNKWLEMAEVNQELTDEGKSYIMGFVGELLDNAERHSIPGSDDGDWWVAGFMARRYEEDGSSHYRCYIGILNEGQTFAETFTRASNDTREGLLGYERQCRRAGCRTGSEALALVYALQDNVTTDQKAESVGRGGYGLMDAIAFACDLGGPVTDINGPNLAIITGGACMIIKPPYINMHETVPRQQWFNSQNDPQFPPDQDVVFDLPYPFPGTLISMAFELDPKHLDQTVEHNED